MPYKRPSKPSCPNGHRTTTPYSRDRTAWWCAWCGKFEPTGGNDMQWSGGQEEPGDWLGTEHMRWRGGGDEPGDWLGAEGWTPHTEPADLTEPNDAATPSTWRWLAHAALVVALVWAVYRTQF